MHGSTVLELQTHTAETVSNENRTHRLDTLITLSGDVHFIGQRRRKDGVAIPGFHFQKRVFIEKVSLS